MPRFHTPDARTGWFRRTARLLVIVLCWQSLAAAWPPVLNSAPRPRAVGLQALVGPALGPVALPPTESASKGIPWDALRATVERQARSLRLDPAQPFRLVELGGGQSAQLMTRLADAASQPASAGAPPAARPGAADSSNLRRVADARTSSDVLAARAAADPLLAPTLDADSADPFIVRKAGELGNDPVQIFAFARDEVVYESYTGSLRGARGTLWSKAGNALDQASLLIALLRASGIRAETADPPAPPVAERHASRGVAPEAHITASR